MGSFSIWHWLVVLAIVLLLFGTGRVSNLMGDLAKGVKAFKKGMAEDDDVAAPTAATETPKALSGESVKPAASAQKDDVAKH
ncbi:MAG TPA: twin-arginine translocase TatA/TatE family subunit [Patescibacteria group bacterium]|nr:twin-arginine translocase TatA/TatE family subunit [Patescibacteria group bacterium]